MRPLAFAALLGLSLSAGAADDGVGPSRRRAEESAAYIAALVHSCREDVRQSIDLAAPQTPSDADDDVLSDTQLAAVTEKLARKAELLRSLAPAAGLKAFEKNPEKLDAVRAEYRRGLRERDMRRAEGDIEYALRRRRIDQVALDPDAKKLLSTAKSFLSDFRQARAPVAELASQDPSRQWNDRVAAIDADAADLKREIRFLEIQFSLLKLQEMNMDSNWR